MYILSIESSCDETSIAVVKDGREEICCTTYSQLAEHSVYGGVVPEIASRAHLDRIDTLTKQTLADAGLALAEVDAVAVTAAPGLIGALLVGVNFAKGLALGAGKPLVPVHHIRGHIASNYLTYKDLAPPFLCLVVSGGHSHIVEVKDYTTFNVVGRTRDDAVGECFDKVARTLGIGHPGGVYLDKLSASGDPNKYKFPNPKVDGSPYDMSFSGLKTAAINLLHNAEQKSEELDKPSVAASFGKTIAEILCGRFFAAAEDLGYKKLCVAGGVAANSQLRALLKATATEKNVELFLPELKYCGDNATMIGVQAYYEFLAGHVGDMSLNAAPTMEIAENF